MSTRYGAATWPLTLLLTGCVLLASSGAARAQDTPAEVSEEELQRLMEALGADAAEDEDAARGAGAASSSGALALGQAINLDMSLILDAAVGYFSADDDALLQTGAHDPNRTGFTLQQLEWHSAAAVDPYLRFEANVVFSQFGVEVEEAYAITQALPWNLQARFGQFLTRFGRLNPSHPHAWSFADQPLVNGKFFGAEGSRGLGVELSWLSPLPWFAEVVVSASDAAGACCARSFYGADDLGVDGPADLLYTAALKQFFSFNVDWSMLFGLSAQAGPNPSGQDNRTEIYGFDLYVKYRPVDSPVRAYVALQLEGMTRARQAPGDALVDHGGYASLVYGFDLRWEAGARYELVTGLADDPLDPAWTSLAQRLSLQTTYYPSHFSRLRLQGGAGWPGDASADPIWSLVLAAEVVVGAHGAHAY